MKKLMSILCIMIMLFSINITAFAEDDVITLSVGEVKANAEPTISVPITLSNNTGICGMTLSIEYDDNLKLADVDAGDALKSLVFTKPGDFSDSPINLLWDGTEEDTTNGVIATLKFETPKKAGTYNISISYEEGEIVDAMLIPLELNIKQGSIEVEETADTLPFTDVPQGKWFYNAVKWAYTNGFLTGTSETTFSPNDPMTRGMLVTVLYRKEGRPVVAESNKFPDVNSKKYYAPAITWASSEGLVSGYSNGAFGPEDSITREQLAKVLFLYAKYKGYDVTASTDLSGFSDASKVSSYAKKYMQWTVAEGLIQGSNGKLNPQGNATRAEISAILKRFVEKYEATVY